MNILNHDVKNPIVFGCYGAARWEKGTDILQAAIRRVFEENPEIPAKFVLQWIDDFNDERGRRVVLDTLLSEHPQVEVIGRYFQGDEYERWLAETDVIVLPYRSPYRLRVSRVVIEAMIHGMPVIATEGTTLFEQAEEHGVVLGCEEGSAESLARAILEFAEVFAAMREAAEKKAEKAAESFSVGYFRELLMNSKLGIKLENCKSH
jgi:glycosyltransferase involved in cell wall biosynthesis